MKMSGMNQAVDASVRIGGAGKELKQRLRPSSTERPSGTDSVTISEKANKALIKGWKVQPSRGAGGVNNIMGKRSFIMRLAQYYKNHYHHLA